MGMGAGSEESKWVFAMIVSVTISGDEIAVFMKQTAKMKDEDC